MAGVDLTTVMDLLGHSNITMTLRYAHLASSYKNKAMEVLENVIGQKPTMQKLYNFKESRCLKVG
jgi:integrase|tara:strand:+ start:319 stop:513 length:195 start_codon:yes stop_codon:yes gene_type:complete